jgi:hypothetical protein
LNFIKFLENRYQELRLESDTDKDAFNLRIEAEIKAVHEVLTLFRNTAIQCMKPKVLWDYCLVQLKKKREPEPVLLNMIRKQKEEEELKAKNELEKKVTPIHTVPSEQP